MAYGPAAGLEIVGALLEEPSLRHYHLLPSVRGDLLLKLGRPNEARAEFERAASLTRNTRERELAPRPRAARALTPRPSCATIAPVETRRGAPLPQSQIGNGHIRGDDNRWHGLWV